MSDQSFSPKILGFLCNWCCYAAADAAGVSRFQYPPNMRTVRVMCSGRVDPSFVLKAFLEGADAIFTGGWQLGECHYQVGNYDAMGMDALVKKVLRDVGIREERFDLQWASAAEAPLFVKLITEFTEKMKDLGPIGEAEGLSKDEVKERIQKALDAVSSQKVRISFGNASKAVRKDAIWTAEHINGIINTKMEKSLASLSK